MQENNEQIRWALCDIYTKRSILEYDDHEVAMRAFNAISPVRQDKYIVLPLIDKKKKSK